MKSDQPILITGASGFLGRACCAAFTAAGFPVRALVRNPDRCGDLAPVATAGIFRCDLPDHIDPRAFENGPRALIHCAYETRSATEEQARRTNLAGTEALLALARENGVRQSVFVSSMAAHDAARSVYGLTKNQLEKRFTGTRDAIVKPGTILGPAGLFQRTREMVARLPVLPLFYGGELQIVWIDDICAAIVSVVERELTGTLAVAHPQGVPIAEFYRGIAALDGRKPVLVPFPGDLALFGIATLERLGLRPPISSDNLLGIKYLHHFDTAADLARLGLHPLSFQESLERLKARYSGQTA